jgi:DNA-binding XRE family transcriptional regulator
VAHNAGRDKVMLTRDYREVLDSLPDEVQQVMLAFSVIRNRIDSLPKPDRDDLFALVQEWCRAETAEERREIQRAMTEILAQLPVKRKPLPEPAESTGLRSWSESVGARIKKLREERGLTQVQLAERAGIPQSHVSRLENAAHSATHKTLTKIAEALGVTVRDLDPIAE